MKPLHQFTVNDVCQAISSWIYNDIHHNQYLEGATIIFTSHSLHGSKLAILSPEDVKSMVRTDLAQFMTDDTLQIAFDCFKKWRNEHTNDIASKSAKEIAHILYNLPLIHLLQTLRSQSIDGKQFESMIQDSSIIPFIQKVTGWHDIEIYQIVSILLKHYTFTKHQFEQHIMSEFQNTPNTHTQLLPKWVLNEIKTTIFRFDVETIQYSIKNNGDFHAFSDSIINMVDDLIQTNASKKQNHNNDAYVEDDFVKRIYECVAGCFILTTPNQNELDKRYDWFCNNCGNINFHSYIASKPNTDISRCCLCGMLQRDSIILKLRNHDRLVMVNHANIPKLKNEAPKSKDHIDDMIANVLASHAFDLSCLNRNDDEICPSILQLARHLIVYKRWIAAVYTKTQGKDSIHKTIQIDMDKYVDDHAFQKVFIEAIAHHGKLTADAMELLTQIVNSNVENIQNIKQFLAWKRMEFAKLIQKHTKIKPAHGIRLYRMILNALRDEAHKKQFGAFLADLDIDIINTHYYHILKSHINHGNKSTMQNVFQFFQTVVHFDDTTEQIQGCRSCTRKQQRMDALDSPHTVTVDRKHDTNIWTLKQYYAQSQLDMIHSYLVHSNWTQFIQRYAKTQSEKDDVKTCDAPQINEGVDLIQNAEKYVTDLADATVTNYGFGIDHAHPHLTPTHYSMRDELLFNALYCIKESVFQHLLIKAIKLHAIAIGEGYEDIWICKYFHPEYNILRNEPIGLRHILSIIVYTDTTKFCTAFRSTYRCINNETSAEEVAERHQELYYYSRCLYESIEFYGTYMEPQLKVYHGLNRVMYFDAFSAYFHQPISTTTSLNTANQFANGQGIILTLKCATDDLYDKEKREMSFTCKMRYFTKTLYVNTKQWF
eukprot:978433_1